MPTVLPNSRDANDAELVCQAQAGSGASFAALADRYRGRLLKFLHTRKLRRHDAEDVVQETLVRAFENIRRCNPARSFAAWLFTIAARQAVSHRRRQSRLVSSADLDPPAPAGEDPARVVAEASHRDRLWVLAERTVSRGQYTALYLRYARELTVREIAREMAITTVHVRVLLHRARKRLLASGALATLRPGARPGPGQQAQRGAP